MKKLLCLLTISFLFISIGYSQEQPKQDESNVVTQVVDKVFDRTTEAVRQLSDVLKVPAEHVYSVLVKQQLILGWCSIIGLITTLLLALGFTWWTYKDDYDNVGIGIVCVIGWISFVAALIVFLADGLGCLLNPEYGAIQDILQSIS